MTKPSYQYTQHPHVEKRKAKHPSKLNAYAHAGVLGTNKLTINQRFGLAITKSVGTMWAAYAFFALSLVSLPAALMTGDTVIIIAWVAQTFLQLVLLPIIIVGQNLQAAKTEVRAIATYEDATAILEEAKEIQAHLTDQDKALSHLIDKMTALEAKLEAAQQATKRTK
ncbi:MAG: hypothetical protein RIS55_101 [Actinomycetota bacterium]|jgi:hypothetical protein